MSGRAQRRPFPVSRGGRLSAAWFLRVRCQRAFLPGLLSAVLLAACGAGAPAPSATHAAAAKPSAAASASQATQAETKLVVGLGQAVVQVLPVWLAQDAGYFAQHNLEVDARVASATTGLAALLSGELNFHVGGGSELLNGVVGGGDLVALGNIAPITGFKFEVAADIKSKDDLIGKKIGVTRFGSATDTGSRSLLRKVGLNPDKDVTFVQLATPGNVLTAMLAGTVQAALQNPPNTLRAEAAGFHPLYDLAQMKVPDTSAVVEARRSWVAANRDVTQRFIDSLVQGAVREKQDKALSVASLKKNLKLDDDAALSAAYDYFSTYVVSTEPYATVDQFADVLTIINAQSTKLKDSDVNAIIDNSFVQSAIDRGLNK
jgi:NitT/TauT family transport system substrate-binding protein